MGKAVAVATAMVLATGPAAFAFTPKVGSPLGNVQVSKLASAITAEDTPSLARNPKNPDELVMVNRVDRPDFTAEVRYSTDGGNTWQNSALQMPAEDQYQGGESLVAHKLYAPRPVWDDNGNLYVLFVTLSGGGNQPDSIWIEKSTDGGQSFRPPTLVGAPSSYQVDLAIDPSTGKLFASWLQGPQPLVCVLCFPGTGYPIVFSESTDGGNTWSTPVSVSDASRAMVGSPVIAVDAQGNPSIIYTDYESDTFDWDDLPGSYTGNFSLVLSRSTNGGQSWSPGIVVDSNVVPPHRFLVYLAETPGFAIGPNDHMVVAWADGRSGNSQILERYSDDDGSTWNGPVTVNSSTANGTVQDIPGLDIAPNGRVDVIYYDGTSTSANVYISSSGDGGATFAAAVELSTQSSDLTVGPQGSPYYDQADFGSHISVLSYNNEALAGWTDTRNGNSGNGKQDIYYTSVTVGGGGTGPSAVVIAIIAVAAALAVAGLVMLISVRRRRGAGRALGGRVVDEADLPPPPPPLVPSPGQV
ncbi:MAG: sialidase family protein [Acidimicrobiales bacterium]